MLIFASSMPASSERHKGDRQNVAAGEVPLVVFFYQHQMLDRMGKADRDNQTTAGFELLL